MPPRTGSLCDPRYRAAPRRSSARDARRVAPSTARDTAWAARRALLRSARPAPSGRPRPAAPGRRPSTPPGSPRKGRCTRPQGAREGALSSGRELVQVGQPELFLQLGHMRHRALEPFVAELLFLLVLELLAHLVVRRFTDQVVERGEEHGVLARRVRPVHAVEDAQELRELLSVAAVAQLHDVR